MPHTLKPLTDATLEHAVKSAPRPLLVEFSARWCPPCRAIEPHLVAIAGSRTDVDVVTVDADDNADAAARLGVRSLPTLLLFDGGRVVAQLVGAQSRARLDAWLDDHVRAAAARVA